MLRVVRSFADIGERGQHDYGAAFAQIEKDRIYEITESIPEMDHDGRSVAGSGHHHRDGG